MKWYNKNLQDGDTRVIKRFALFPVCVKNECRWLEFVRIYQIYTANYAGDGWYNDHFVNKNDYCY